MIWFAVLLSGVSLMLFSPLYLGGSQGRVKLSWKGLATLCAVGIACAGAVSGQPAWWACGALLACALADVLLEVKFLWGVGCFALGHGLYILHFLSLAPFTFFHLLPISALMVIAACLLWAWREHLGSNAVPFALYGVILCAMGGAGVATGIALGGIRGMLAAFGGLIFILSDIFVLRQVLFPVTKTFTVVGFYLYEIAQLLIAWSVIALPAVIG